MDNMRRVVLAAVMAVIATACTHQYYNPDKDHAVIEHTQWGTDPGITYESDTGGSMAIVPVGYEVIGSPQTYSVWDSETDKSLMHAQYAIRIQYTAELETPWQRYKLWHGYPDFEPSDVGYVANSSLSHWAYGRANCSGIEWAEWSGPKSISTKDINHNKMYLNMEPGQHIVFHQCFVSDRGSPPPRYFMYRADDVTVANVTSYAPASANGSDTAVFDASLAPDIATYSHRRTINSPKGRAYVSSTGTAKPKYLRYDLNLPNQEIAQQ